MLLKNAKIYFQAKLYSKLVFNIFWPRIITMKVLHPYSTIALKNDGFISILKIGHILAKSPYFFATLGGQIMQKNKKYLNFQIYSSSVVKYGKICRI